MQTADKVVATFAASGPVGQSDLRQVPLDESSASPTWRSRLLSTASTLVRAPFVTVNLAIMFGLGGLAIAYNGEEFIGTLTNGGLNGVALVMAAQSIVLMCSMAATVLGTQSSIQDAKRIQERQAKAIERISEQGRNTNVMLHDISAYIEGRGIANVLRIADTPEFWHSVRPGSWPISIQPSARMEMSERRNADGEIEYDISRKGIINVLRRYGPGFGVEGASIVMVQTRDQIANKVPSTEMLRLAALLSASSDVAMKSGLSDKLDFSGVRLYLVEREDVDAASCFLIEAQLAGKQSRRLLVRYDGNKTPLAPVFGCTLEVVTDQSEVDAALINADRMIKSAARTMSVTELLSIYGPSVRKRCADTSALTSSELTLIGWPSVGPISGRTGGIVDFEDGSYSLGDYLC